MDPGDKAYKNAKYFTAVSLYKKAMGRGASKEDKQLMTFKIAECYRLMNNSKQAESWYDRTIKANYDEPTLPKLLADAQKTNEKFDEASLNYESYLEKYPNDTAAQNGLKACKLILKWKERPLNFETYLESALNTRDEDFAPTFYFKGIIFTSAREKIKGKKFFEWTGKGYTNLYASAKNERNKWSKPEPLSKDINTPYNEGVSTFDSLNNILYYTQCNGAKGKSLGCRIYMTSQKGKVWSTPAPVNIPTIDSNTTVGNPSVSADGKRLYYVAELPQGLGGKDIYYSDKVGDGWGTPVNLGSVINTSEDDNFPFIHKSGTLYFASKGHEGIGGYDIFYSDPENGQWTDPINLKYPLNSTADDLGLILDDAKENGYFASNRPGGKGEDDIYSAIAIPLEFNVYGKATNAQNNKILPDTKISLTGSDGFETSVKTDKSGVYKIKLKRGVNYILNASKTRFFGDNGSTSTIGYKESQDFEVNFKLNPIPLKDIVLKGILYDLDKADLRPESITILDSLIKTLRNNPTFVIEIASHTDSRADSAHNMDLSQRRAQSVVDYLTSKDIEKERLIAKGYGESQLLNDCKDGVDCTEEQHQLNRRTSFKVVSEDFVPKKKTKVPGGAQPNNRPRPINNVPAGSIAAPNKPPVPPQTPPVSPTGSALSGGIKTKGDSLLKSPAVKDSLNTPKK